MSASRLAGRAGWLALRADTLPIALIAAAAMLLYVPFFNAFAVPYPDFFQYCEDALAYLQGTVPAASKRLPLFPLVIGGLSRILPGPNPIMLAAQLLNLALAPVCLWLIYRITRAFVGAAFGAAIVILCAVNQTFYYAAIEPNLEMTILATVLLTVHLALRGSRWAYAAAFLASLTCHDILPLIPLLVLQDTVLGRRPWQRSLALGAWASAGFVAWTTFNLWHTTLLRHPYIAELLARDGEVLAFLKGSLRVVADFLPAPLFRFDLARLTIGLLQLGLLGGGIILCVRRHRTPAAFLAGFLIAYTIGHVIFPAYLPRYTTPILWLMYLMMGIALEGLVSRLPVQRATRSGAAALLLCAMAASGITSSVRFMQSHYVLTNRSAFRQAGEWYRAAATPGDKLVTSLWRVVGYYSGRPEAVVYSGRLEASSLEALVEELRAKGVTYVVWDSHYGHDASYDATRHKAHLLTWLKERSPQHLQLVHRIPAGREEVVVYRFLPEGLPS